jgi:alpha-L-rhamnosidase
MNRPFSSFLFFQSVLMASFLLNSCNINEPALESNAQWITVPEFRDSSLENSWIAFSKTFKLQDIPDQALARIAADTKYWLWLNDSLIVREGGLKWGPSPKGYYEDEVTLGNYLKKGENIITCLVWYMGKEGMSHQSSGQAGLWLHAPDLGLVSDESWMTALHPAFQRETVLPHPNWRLPESNILFDARQVGPLLKNDLPLLGFPIDNMEKAAVFSRKKINEAEKRPIPFWKDFGLKKYDNSPSLPLQSQGDTLVLDLPYNAQITPFFRIKSPEGLKIDIRTDNYKGGSEYNVRTEYITQAGEQVFETPGWMNGHRVRYHFPEGIQVLDLQYRESGYATEFAGAFQCDDPFFNELWKKARRTLYITMRDNYMDCPDRERAQWWGDVVLESGEAFYALDRKSDLLTRKGMLELMNWQKEDSTIYSPVPAGNWDKELPTQMLASVGYYGFWNYFMHTGDTATIREVYPKVKAYLNVWQTDASGLVIPRSGGWTWGDWGNNKDMPIIFNGWYYLALKGFREMSELLGQQEQAQQTAARMQKLAAAFHRQFWNGQAYRSPDHQGSTDDRSQALAVVTGIASEEYYPAIRKVFQEEYHASPYFEKYICEALFMMGYPEDALARLKKRFGKMVDSKITTLWEGWAIGDATWGGGTYNHAWSGGGLTLLSQYVAGVSPLEAGYKKVAIKPQLGNLNRAEASIMTVQGELSIRIEKREGETIIDYDAPPGMEVLLE